MNLEHRVSIIVAMIPLVTAIISVIGNIIQYKSSKTLLQENQYLKNQITRIELSKTQDHSIVESSINAGRDVSIIK